MLLGAIVALGSTLLWPVALWLSFTWLLLSRPKPNLPRPLLIACACIGITTLWSPNPGEPLAWIMCVILAWIAARRLSNRYVWIPILTISLIHSGIGMYEYASGLGRVRGLAENASMLGMSGLALLPLGGLVVGLSLSRTALLGLGILTISHPTRLMFVSLVIATTLSFAIGYQLTPSRYTLSGIERDYQLRIATITGESVETLPGATVKPVERQWKWYGFGHGGYYLSTGQIQPHNIFILSLWELGILCVPFWGSIIWLWWTHGRNVPLAAVVLTCGMLTDELLGSIQGVFIATGIAVTVKNWGLTWLHLRILSLLPTR